jgi:hypothetical protein
MQSDLIAALIDRLVPQKELDPYEQALYLYLLHESHLRGSDTATISVNALRLGGRMSRRAAEPRLRTLAAKGCIQIIDTGWAGTKIRVVLPDEIVGPAEPGQANVIDLEAVDFFSERRYRDLIVQRDASRCFYCLKPVTSDNCTLDHVDPQVDAGGHGYRNIVTACHSCNASKNATAVEDFLRSLWRRSRLSDEELDGRLQALESLRAGRLRPSV